MKVYLFLLVGKNMIEHCKWIQSQCEIVNASNAGFCDVRYALGCHTAVRQLVN